MQQIKALQRTFVRLIKRTALYERHARRFDTERPKKLHEKPWLDRFAALLPAGAEILDCGCGAGDPIAGYFLSLGYDVTGIDAADAMIELVRSRFPANQWLRADMRDLDLGRNFDGIIAWNSFFHLTRQEQRKTLSHFAAHLKSGGALMLTVGPEDGEVTGHVGGDLVYHASLSPEEYRDILNKHGLEIVNFVAEDPKCDFQTVLLARKRPQ